MSEPLSKSFPTPVSRQSGDTAVLEDRAISRRGFLGLCGAGLCLLPGASLLSTAKPAQAIPLSKKGLIGTKLSPWFTPLEGKAVRCELCPKTCRVKNGKRGHCRVRENRGGMYYSLVYGNPCAVHMDPIEKKPFYHVLPSTWSFSIATAGCNFSCHFCQNWEISQSKPEHVYAYDFSPERIVAEAIKSEARSIAYTYVEPMIFYEYMIDICRLAKEAGLVSVCHSNAFVNPEPLKELCSVMDAANCDLKGFTEEYYRDMCGGRLGPVLESLKRIRGNGVHLELTNLVIPTRNDDLATVEKMCRWIRKELGEETPVHFSRFYPQYRLQDLPPTPVSTLDRIREVAMNAGLKFAYVGNVPGNEGQHTYCPGCGEKIITRVGYMVKEMKVEGGKCEFCGTSIPGLWA